MKTFRATTPCEVNVNRDEASRLIDEVDVGDRDGRIDRLVGLTHLLPTDDMVGFSGQAAEWLFEDIQATWLYGCFTSTVLTAHAFCSLQVAGLLRLVLDDPSLPEEAQSLEHLAAIAEETGAIDHDLQAQLLNLHDRYRAYTAADLHEHQLRLERHLVEMESVGGEDPLVADARQAVTIAISLVYRR